MSATAHLPDQFGRYRIVKLLGSGAMGSVYLARDTNLDRDVALKVPRFIDGKEPQIIARFYQEARAAATVHHPHVCPVYDVGETDGVHFLTMAFIEGKPLEQWVGSGKPLNQRQVATIGRKVADAIGEAHKKGVIHRDLKPANIMIDKRGEPVVMDFGLARRARADDTRLTRAGTVLGSPAYMSPEQIRGDTDTTGPATDIFSLGVILYELLARRLPFDGETIGAVHAQILMEDPPPLRDFHPDLDPALDAVVLKALAKKVEDRFPTMGQMAAALKAYLDGKAATDPGQTRAPAATVSSPPPPASSALHGSAFAGRSLVLAEHEEHDRPAPRLKRKKKKGSKGGAKKPPVWAWAAGGAVVLAVVVGLAIGLRKDKQPEHAGTPDSVPVNNGTGPGGGGGKGTRPPVAEQVNVGTKELPPSAGDDLGRLQGEWAVEAEEWKGKPVAPDELRQQSKRLVFDGNRLTFHRQGKDRPLTSAGTVRVAPGSIDFTGTDYFGKPREFRGIFDLTGDTFRLAYPNTNAGLVRPTALASSADGDTLVITARRKVPAPATEFRQLFNGKDLTGWKYHPSQPGNWTVRNGILTSGGPVNHLFSDRGDYDNFHLRAEARINANGNSGIIFRSEFGLNLVLGGRAGTYPAGYEAQIYIGGPEKTNRTGSLLPGFAPVNDRLVRPGEWFVLEVIADGNHLVTRVDGKPVVDFTDPKRTYTRGHIALKHMDPATVVEFRKIEVKELGPAAAAPAPRPFVSVFNGKDLTGWTVDKGPQFWRVAGGALAGTASPKLITAVVTDRDYSDFVLRLEYQFSPGGIGRVTYRSPPDPGNPLAVLLVDDGPPSAGTGRTGAFLGWKPAARQTQLRRDDWNRLELTVKGTTVSVHVNGVEVNQSTLDNAERYLGHPAPAAGRIGFQVANGTFRFRNIEVQDLSPTAAGSSGK